MCDDDDSDDDSNNNTNTNILILMHITTTTTTTTTITAYEQKSNIIPIKEIDLDKAIAGDTGAEIYDQNLINHKRQSTSTIGNGYEYDADVRLVIPLTRVVDTETCARSEHC